MPNPPRQAPVRSVEVPRSLDGERLDRACAALFPDLSRGEARRAIDRGAVTLDGKRVRACSRPVRPGAILTVAPPPAQLAELHPLVIVHEDDHLVVVDKPAGQLTQPSPLGSAGTLLDALEQHFRRGRARPFIGLVHRLDREASGLIAFGRSKEATAALSATIRDRTAVRRYEALVRGTPSTDEGRIDLPLHHDRRTNRASVDPDRGKPAATRWQVVRRAPEAGLTLVTAWLETGRTHQLRVHLAAALGPIAGDRRYGDPTLESGVSRLHLHARQLALPHPATGQPLDFESPLPDGFLDLIG